jgi:uncharacterized protein (TIGR03000 family)
MLKFVASVVLAVVGIFAAMPTPAEACWRGRYYGGYGWGSYPIAVADYGPRTIVAGQTWYSPVEYSYTYRGFFRGWRRTAYYQPYAVAYAYPSTATAYSAFYPAEMPTNANAATIIMHVPSTARVWIEGGATTQTGPDRLFVSPGLTPGQDYVYHIRVQWEENGSTMERTREVAVRAGNQVELNVQR